MAQKHHLLSVEASPKECVGVVLVLLYLLPDVIRLMIEEDAGEEGRFVVGEYKDDLEHQNSCLQRHLAHAGDLF